LSKISLPENLERNIPVTTFSFPVRALKATAVAIANEETRFYLNGVFIEPCGPHAVFVATDGHRLLACKVEGEIGGLGVGIIIPAHVIAQIKLPAPSVRRNARYTEKDSASLIVEGGKYALRFDGVTVDFTPIEASFPAWRRVIPAEVSGEAGHFNSALLHEFAKAKQIATGEKDVKAPALRQNGPDSPAFVTFERPDGMETPFEMFGVVMPWRGPEIGTFARPEWAGPIVEAENQAQAA
jgi:DNA polymerase III sliding clamp (beta) subunit (PCNA family)